VPPLVARHSGLAEIAAGVEAEYPPDLRDLTSFTDDLPSKLRRLLDLPDETRRELGRAARRAVVKRWSWSSVAQRLLKLQIS
jgi:glycosyltransferase involved in cell wall biosynthesis